MVRMKRLRQADLHLHSNVSHDVPGVARLSPRALFEKALGERRLDYFTLTDHDGSRVCDASFRGLFMLM